MLLKCKSPFNGKTNKIIIAILSILLGVTLIRIWLYNIQISNFNTKLSESFHTQAKSSLQYIYTCFLNSSQPFSSFVPSDLKDDVKYAVIIDAGSSGSRVYIYYWSAHSEQNSGIIQISQLVDIHDQPIVKKVSPGLTYFRNPRLAYKNGIQPLLTFVLQHIPDDRIPFTPVYVLATAGMRLIPTLLQNKILTEVEHGIRRDFNFKLSSDNIRVISGVDEGVYSWLAINYILNRLDAVNTNNSSRLRTVGSLDMGGGSLQITYELPRTQNIEDDETNTEIINFGNDHKYRLYVTTYLNYGANQVREAHFSQLADATLSSMHNFSIHNQSAFHAIDPCLHRSQREFRTYNGHSVNFTGSGNYNLCRQLLTSHLKLEDPCPAQPSHCKMNGVYQAPIDFTKTSFYGFSEFWYTMDDVLNIGGTYYRDKFDLSAHEYCNIDWNTVLDWRSKNLYPGADFERLASQCFKSAWLSVAIHRGFGFPDNYKYLQSIDRIEGREIQWTMGALLYKLMHSSDSKLSSFSHIYSLKKKLSSDYIYPIFAVLIALILLFLVWYFFIPKRRNISGGKSFLPLLDTIQKRGHLRASSFPFPPTSSQKSYELPRVTSNNSIRSILSLNGDREFLDIEKVK